MTNYQRFGSYVITELFLDVPYGQVFRAVKTQGLAYLDHLYVVLMSPELREAGFEAALDRHRDWIEAFEVGGDSDSAHLFDGEGGLCFAFPFVRGRSVAELMLRNAEDNLIRMGHVYTIAQQFAHSLDALNSNGLVHGALGLDSLWIDLEGRGVHLVDAPIGKPLCACGFQNRAMGALADVKKHFGVDFQNDQETFGLVLFHLISGRWPNAMDPVGDILGLSMVTGGEWGDQEVVEVPASLKAVILKSIGGGYQNSKELVGDMDSAFNDDEAEPFNASEFDVAFLLSSLFRQDLPGEAAAIEMERSNEFAEMIGEPKIIEKERIVLTDDPVKRRRNIAIALVLATLGIAGGVFALVRASKHRERQEAIKIEQERIKAEQERLKRESANQYGLFEQKEAAWQSFAESIAKRMASAKTQGERLALQAEYDAKRKAHEAEMAAIKANIDRLHEQEQAIGVVAKRAPASISQPTAQVVSAATPASQPGNGTPVGQQAPSAPRERPRVNPDNIPFAPSVHVPISDDSGVIPKQEAVYLSGATKVETLRRPDQVGAGGDGGGAVVQPPAVTTRNQSTADRFRRLVMPPLGAEALKAFAGKVIRVRILFDQFGQAKTANVEDAPSSLTGDFRLAAMQTELKPIMENGRSKGGWVVISYRVTGTGITLDGYK